MENCLKIKGLKEVSHADAINTHELNLEGNTAYNFKGAHDKWYSCITMERYKELLDAEEALNSIKVEMKLKEGGQ